MSLACSQCFRPISGKGKTGMCQPCSAVIIAGKARSALRQDFERNKRAKAARGVALSIHTRQENSIRFRNVPITLAGPKF